MGWSMNGILAGAVRGFGKGVSDWAQREIDDEKKQAEELRLVERQKEMARYNDELAGARDVSKAELTEKMNERVELKKRENYAAFMTELTSHTKDLGLEPGSKEWLKAGFDFAIKSGRPDEGKMFMDQYNKERELDNKEEATRARLEAAAMRRNSDGGDSRAEERAEKAKANWFKQIGTYSVVTTDPETGKPKRVTDNSQIPLLDQVYTQALSNPATKAQAKDFVQAAAVNGQALYKKDPTKYADVGHATQVWVASQMTPKTQPAPAPTAAAAPAPAKEATRTTNSGREKQIPY